MWIFTCPIQSIKLTSEILSLIMIGCGFSSSFSLPFSIRNSLLMIGCGCSLVRSNQLNWHHKFSPMIACGSLRVMIGCGFSSSFSLPLFFVRNSVRVYDWMWIFTIQPIKLTKKFSLWLWLDLDLSGYDWMWIFILILSPCQKFSPWLEVDFHYFLLWLMWIFTRSNPTN